MDALHFMDVLHLSTPLQGMLSSLSVLRLQKKDMLSDLYVWRPGVSNDLHLPGWTCKAANVLTSHCLECPDSLSFLCPYPQGIQLELRWGSTAFAGLIVELLVLSHTLVVAGTAMLAHYIPEYRYNLPWLSYDHLLGVEQCIQARAQGSYCVRGTTSRCWHSCCFSVFNNKVCVMCAVLPFTLPAVQLPVPHQLLDWHLSSAVWAQGCSEPRLSGIH